MKERIFALKKGTEVPAQFDGVTIPYVVPTSDAEIQKLVPVEADRVAVFNQAYALGLQKSVKVEADKRDEKGNILATVESLRAHARDFKIEKVRTKGAGTGKSTVKAAQVASVLGDDFLAMMTPELRKLYDEKMAQHEAQRIAAAKPKAETAAEAPAAPAAAPTGGAKQNKNSR